VSSSRGPAQQVDSTTLQAVASRYLEQRTHSLASGAEIRRTLERDLLPTLGDRSMASISPAEIIAPIEHKAGTAPRAAGLLLSYVEQLWTYAEDRVLSDIEIRRFWHHAESCGMHRLTALALQLILVTGQRPGEVAGLHCREIAERVIGHAPRGIVAIYNRHRYEKELRKALQAWDARLEALVASHGPLPPP
jgi:integrase